MMKSSTTTSRSTVFNSKISSKSSKRRKKKKLLKSIEKVSLSETEILAKKTIKDIIEHSIQIADFHIRHKRYQRAFENRKIKREQNFITPDGEFTGYIHQTEQKYDWSYISRIIGKIIHLESNGDLKIYDFNTENNCLQVNLLEDSQENVIIAAEFYEHEQSAKFELFILFQNFIFMKLDLFYIYTEVSKTRDREVISKIINSSKKSFFICKPYLNIPNIDEYWPNYENNLKIIIFPKKFKDYCTDIILNFTQISGKFLIYNTLSNTVIGNYIINQKDYVTTESDYLSNLRKLICAFFDKVWSVKQYEYLCKLINTICGQNQNENENENIKEKNNINILEELKKLSLLLNMASNDEGDNLSLILQKQEYTFTEIKGLKTAQERHINSEKLYSSVILPIFAKSSSGHCIISFENLLLKIKNFFDKLYDCSIAVGKADLSLIKGRFKLYQTLFLKCYNRKINLKQLFLDKDPNNYGYVDENVAFEILQNLPIGLTDSEIEQLISSYNILDENRKYMYDYLFLLDEQIITKIVFSSPLNLLGSSKFTCGYFIKNMPEKNVEFNERQLNNIKGKMSAPTEHGDEILSSDSQFILNDNYGNKIEEKGNLAIPENTFNYDDLIDYIINSCFTIEITDIVILTSLNLIFIVTPYNQNIPIFKCSTKYTNKTQKLELIGNLNLNSSYPFSPLFLYCIEKRNLLITQRITNTSTDIVFIDISKDLLFPSRDKKTIEYTVNEKDKKCKLIKNLLTFPHGRENVKLFNHFEFLKKNELFAISSDDCIYIINPKSHTNDISLKMQEIKKTVYTKLCRSFCENPDEKTGEPKFKVLYKINLTSSLKKFSLFSLGSDLLGENHFRQYSNTDWIVLLFDTGEISSYCVNQVNISQKAKEIDTPLPESDVEQLFAFAIKNMKKSLLTYENYLIKFPSYYNMIRRKNEETVDQITFNIKETMLYEKQFKFNPKEFQMHTIYELIYILKMMNLKFDTCQTFQMFPTITFSRPKYEADADYFKTELFPKDKNYEEIGINIEDINLPKNKNELISDLSSLESNLSIIDSAVKKLGKYIIDNNLKNDQIFKKIDVNEEEILDYDQFCEGCEKLGLLGKDYLNKEEIRIMFDSMDANHSSVLTLDEYNKYLEKIDIYSIKSNIINEKEKRIKEQVFDYDIEKFANSSEEEKKQILSPIFEKIQNFYSNLPNIEYNDIKDNMKIISEKISINEIENKFSHGFIFLDDLKNLLYQKIPNITEEQMNKIFAYFDQKNMNLFIYVRDFIKYLKKKDGENSDMNNINMIQQLQQKMIGEKFLLILIASIKKVLKICIMELGLSPDNFSENFILSKKYEKHIVILNYIQTEIAKNNLKKKITNFLPLEEKILFNYYIDFYNYGILFADKLKIVFDNMMKFINDSDIYDLTKFDTFDSENANQYINKKKYNMNKHEKNLENNYLQNLLPIFDKTLLEFAYHTQKKDNMKNLTLLYNYLKTIGEEKDFLTQKEFMKMIQDFIPVSVFNSIFSNNLINQLSENVVLINEPIRPVISVSRIILFIINTIKKYEILNPTVNIQDIFFADKNILLNNFNTSISRLSQYNLIMNQINNLSVDYLNIIKNCNFTGLIIVNKNEIINDIKNNLHQINLNIMDYNNYYLNLGNNRLLSNFSKVLKKGIKDPDYKNLNILSYDESLSQNFLSLIKIPIVKIDVIDTKEMINLKKYQSGMIENFDYFQPELQCYVNVTKIRKSFLLQQISKDNMDLLQHIILSLKLNHYLQQKYIEKTGNKSFDNFSFLRNFGIYSKEILIDKIIEEEFYVVNEKINLKEYICLNDLAKTNGGLFYIPEIANTEMGFFILRIWGKNLLNIINEFNQINMCFKYFNIKDFFGSINGRRLKMSNIYSYNCYDENGKITMGPDIFKILMLLDKLPTGTEEQLSFEMLDNIYSNDAYIAPEIIKNIKDDGPNYKIDTWLYGVLLFNIVFGETPKSFYLQLKNWGHTFLEDLSIEQLLKDDEFDILKSNFFYNPFSNIKEIVQENNYFTKVLKSKSFASLINNSKTSSNKYNLSTFIDLINACLNINPDKRPSISTLINFDLFEIDHKYFSLYYKDVSNVMDYYSPNNAIRDKMVLPLRNICCEILRNQEIKPYEINNYQNYIFNVIYELNSYLFNKALFIKEENEKDKSSYSSTNEEYEDFQDIFMHNTSEYKYKNSVLVKYVVEYKVVDLLIFLVLRHFNNNLKLFKQKIKNEHNTNEEEKNSNLNTYRSNNNNTMFRNMNLNTNASFTERNTNKNYYIELNNYCGKLISALIKFLFNCVESLNSYEHVMSLYVEDVLIWIIKLFIGEENQLLGDICDYRNSNDKLKKYIYYRTFMRDENIVMQKDFQEDDLDQVFSILNSNKQLIEIKSYWSPELYYFVNNLFREAFGENCSGSFKHSVIKNYFLSINSYNKEENKINPLSKNNEVLNFISNVEGFKQTKIKYNFINSVYVSELLNIVDILKKLSDKTKNLKQKNEIKRNALNYINIVFKNKNSSKIRGCLDCKIHFIIQKFLYTSINDLGIKKELFNILKEISLSLLDMNEISWLFGNNYEKIFEAKNKNKNNLIMDLENNPYINESKWDSSTSLIDFTNDILTQPHMFVLNFTNKFLKVNIKDDLSTVSTHMKEFGYIFSSPLVLKPIMRCLQKRTELYNIRQICLEILFNILLSNEIKITSNLNMTLSNFYEILIEIITIVPNKSSLKPYKSNSRNEDDFEIGEKEKYFLESVSKVIKIVIEMQNPEIKKQIFNCPTILKYMEKNKLKFVPKLELNEIEEEFNKIKDMLNFENLEGKIVFLIGGFKSWIYEANPNMLNENISKIRNIITIIHHIFNNEWSNGIKSPKKNCLVFNIVKLFEWLIISNHREYLFPKNSESFTSTIFISFMSKIKENSEKMKELVIEMNKMTVVPKNEKNKTELKINIFANNMYNMNKIYNYICIKLLNIIYTIFSLGDSYYNAIFNKMKIGILLSELFIYQLETLSLFLNQDNIDISIINNYMAEVKIRIGLIETISSLPKTFDDIKMQFLQSEFINYVFRYMIDDNRKFRTSSKKLSLEFLNYKNSFPMRNEAIVILDIIFKKYYNLKKRTDADCYIYDEIIRNVKVFHLVQNQLAIIKTKIKGSEVLSVLGFFNMILSNNEREIIKIMNLENAKDYFIYALQKETSIKKMFPFIVEYIDKVQAGIEK